jgi:hypothetical protein
VKSKIKLFVIDLDGTSLGGTVPYARFTQEYSEFLDSLADAGCKWAINTTWDVNGQWDLVMNSPLKSRPSYLIGEYSMSFAAFDQQAGELKLEQEYCDRMQKRLSDFRATGYDELALALQQAVKIEKYHFYGHAFSCEVAKGEENALADFVNNQLMPNGELD